MIYYDYFLVRGGSRSSGTSGCRSAIRGASIRVETDYYVTFRLVFPNDPSFLDPFYSPWWWLGKLLLSPVSL